MAIFSLSYAFGYLYILSFIREANKCSSVIMVNPQFLILKYLGVYNHPRPATVISHVRWIPPLPSWIKANTDGAARGALGPSGWERIFRTCKGIVKCCFSLSIIDWL